MTTKKVLKDCHLVGGGPGRELVHGELRHVVVQGEAVVGCGKRICHSAKCNGAVNVASI